MNTKKFSGEYRFTTPYDTFRRCVDIAKKLLEQEQLLLLFGCTKKVKFYLCIREEQFCDEYQDITFQEFQSVLLDEVVFIVEQNILMPGIEEPSLAGSLKDRGYSEEDIQKLVDEKMQKRKYVQEQISTGNAVLRYDFKEKTLANKLSNIGYEINKYVFSDDVDMPYAVIEFTSADKLGEEGVPEILLGKTTFEKTKFVCDKQDLEYIIMQLEKIKEKL